MLLVRIMVVKDGAANRTNMANMPKVTNSSMSVKPLEVRIGGVYGELAAASNSERQVVR